MIKNKEFKKLCNLSKTILQKRPNISNLGNPFLFLVSGHPFFLSRYKHINSKKINFLFYLNYILKIKFNLVKIFFYTFKIFLTKNKNNINKKKNYQFIILSHIINKKNFYKKIDSQFGGIEKKFPPKKTIFFYLDHIKLSQIDLEKKINDNHNFYLNNDCVDFKIYYKIIKNIFFEFSFFLKKSLKTKKNFDKKFYLACSQYLLSLSTVKNISLFYNIEKFILENNVKTIVTTLEGHPYEFLVFFPKVLETFSRVSVEAKMVGCKLYTNNLLGAASESWFSKDKNAVIQEMRLARNKTYKLFTDSFELSKEVPLYVGGITVILNAYRRPQNLKKQLEAIRKQSIVLD